MLWSSAVTILLLSLFLRQSHTETTPPPTQMPTMEPTHNPTFEPSNFPTLEPTPDTQFPTQSPTTFPTTTASSISFLEVICATHSDNKSLQYTISLSESNGFNHNQYTQTNTDDTWTINDIQIPNTNLFKICYVHIYLSNKDYWGYRSNATCVLQYTIDNTDTSNANLNLYNALDINQKYSTFWDIKTLDQTSFSFASYPMCANNNTEFANMNVKDFVKNADFNSIIDQSNAETITSANGLWPYYFHLASYQRESSASQGTELRIRPGFDSSNGHSCNYSTILPVYDTNENDSKVEKGGIDYYLFVNSTENVTINIEINQFCDITQPISISTTDDGTDDDENNTENDEIVFNLGVSILLSFIGCFVLMAIGNFALWLSEDQQCQKEALKQEMEVEMQTVQLKTAEISDILETEEIEEETEKFVVTTGDHQEMLILLREGSMSVGLE